MANGLQVPSWRMPKPQPTAQAPTSPIGQTPAGGTPTGGNNPGGFSNTGITSGKYGQSPGTAPVPGVNPTGRTDYIDPTGNWTPFTPTANPWGGTDWKAGEGTNLYDLQMQRLMMLLGNLKGFGSMGGPQDPLPREVPGAAPGREVPSTMADRTAMESATFGRAKDRIGKLGGAAMMALKDRSTAGGRSNSGLEAKDRREIVSGTQSQLGEVIRDQAIDAADRADQIDDRNLATGVAQRGQDLSTRAGDQASNVQQRGQDYNALLNPYQNPLLSMIPQLYGMTMPRY